MESLLPIQEVLAELKQTLSFQNTVILQAPPGAGKSTILPLELMGETWLKGKKIILLEPRRMAAKMVCERMASLLNQPIGNQVGYQVRFENKTNKNTRIEVLTEGILTRRMQQDNSLDEIGMVIFDEFHERSLHADLALAICREIQQVLRNDLRILIMSATLDSEKLSLLLNEAPIITSKGRQYPIQLKYLALNQEYPIYRQMATGIKKMLLEEEGDILAFLPGAGEILKTQELLNQELINIKTYPLYGDLSQQDQQKAILPDKNGARKIVLSTSIAETSLTIEGIKIVVDSGYSRVPKFDAKTGLTKLETNRVTKDTADQRAGRAGRLGPGVCLRLWSEATQHNLKPHRTPEILEADLSPTILELANWGKHDFKNMTWLSSPPNASLEYGKDLLSLLGALNENQISKRGKNLLAIPAHPRIAHLLLEGKNDNLAALACDIAAILEEKDPLSKNVGTNLSLRIEALRKWRQNEFVTCDRKLLERIERTASIWRKHLSVAMDNSTVVEFEVGKLLALAYPERIARRKGNGLTYRLKNGKTVKINEQDPLNAEEWIAIAHMDAGTSEGRIYLAAALNTHDILYLAQEKKAIEWDYQKGILIARTDMCIGDIILESKPMLVVPEEEKTKILIQFIKSAGMEIFYWPPELLNLIAKISSLRIWQPEENWPDLSIENLLDTSEKWIYPFLSNVKKKEDFYKLNLLEIISESLSWETAKKINELVPNTLKVPSGSDIEIKYYANGNTPSISVRLQEVFGMVDTPTINQGRTKLILHLLSPGYKAVQITQDLKSFWKNTYPEVRKELRVKYLRHHWPEDPWTAEAMRGAKKRGT